MDVALIAPTSHVVSLCSRRPVQLALAHRILVDPGYAAAYKKLSLEGSFVIVDNSLIELGEAMPLERVVQAAQMVHANEIVLPDVFRCGPETLQSVDQAILELDRHSLLGSFRLLALAHGRDRHEWVECFDVLTANNLVDTIGIPKVLDEVWQPGGRIGCVQYLKETGRINGGHQQFHLLGIWTDPIEVLLLRHNDWIRSIDTALPIHAGMTGVRFGGFGLEPQVRPRRPRDYFDLTIRDKDCMEAVRHNITMIDTWSK